MIRGCTSYPNQGRDLARDRYKGRQWYASLGPHAEDEFYYAHIRTSHEATMVKLADIHDNTAQWRLVYLPEHTQDRLREKYAKARELLTS